jgi:hypothetical protein
MTSLRSRRTEGWPARPIQRDVPDNSNRRRAATKSIRKTTVIEGQEAEIGASGNYGDSAFYYVRDASGVVVSRVFLAASFSGRRIVGSSAKIRHSLANIPKLFYLCSPDAIKE